MAIEADPVRWNDKRPDAGKEGMKVARCIASYYLTGIMKPTHGVNRQNEQQITVTNFKSESYQRYQGEKLAKRFNAFSYYQTKPEHGCP